MLACPLQPVCSQGPSLGITSPMTGNVQDNGRGGGIISHRRQRTPILVFVSTDCSSSIMCIQVLLSWISTIGKLKETIDGVWWSIGQLDKVSHGIRHFTLVSGMKFTSQEKAHRNHEEGSHVHCCRPPVQPFPPLDRTRSPGTRVVVVVGRRRRWCCDSCSIAARWCWCFLLVPGTNPLSPPQ